MSNNSMVFSMLRRNQLASKAEQKSNDSEFQTGGALKLKAFADNASVMRDTDSKSLSDDLKEYMKVCGQGLGLPVESECR